MEQQDSGRKIAVYSFKGGQGKTSISVQLALELGYGIITNDIITEYEEIFPKELLLKLEPNHPVPSAQDLDGADIIFDFGGFIDLRVIPALEMSHFVLIPLIDTDKINIDAFTKSINAISKYNKNIIIILNRMNKNDRDLVREEIGKLGINYPIFAINNNKALKIVYEEKRPLSEIIKDNELRKYHYQATEQQFRKIINYITK